MPADAALVHLAVITQSAMQRAWKERGNSLCQQWGTYAAAVYATRRILAAYGTGGHILIAFLVAPMSVVAALLTRVSRVLPMP